LQFDPETRRSPTFLLKFEAGATYPAHNHPGGEEVFVIKSDIRLGKDHLHTGDYLFTALERQARGSLGERLRRAGQNAASGRDFTEPENKKR